MAATLDGLALTIEWDGAARAPRAWRQIVAAKQELPVVPIYWFALLEQFPTVRTLKDSASAAEGRVASSPATAARPRSRA